MLGTSGDGLITKLTSYLAADSAIPHEVPPPTLDQPGELYPTLTATVYDDAEAWSDDRTGLSARLFSKTIPRHSLKKSASELVKTPMYKLRVRHTLTSYVDILGCT